MKCFTVAFVTALALGTTATPQVALGQKIDEVAKSGSKGDKLKKLQIINRAYQVCYGRGLKRSEAQKLLGMAKAQIVSLLLESPELTSVFAERLTAFAQGGEGSSTARELDSTAALTAVANPTEKLDDVLSQMTKDRHKGEQCGDEKNSACFARWLVQRVAPSLGGEWVKANAADIPNWTYARLLEQITISSL